MDYACEVCGVAADFGLGMDALVTICPWNKNIINGLGMDALVHRMLLEHERYYGLGMDALVTVCSWNTNVLMVWALVLFR